jgi:hypothetical protein
MNIGNEFLNFVSALLCTKKDGSAMQSRWQSTSNFSKITAKRKNGVDKLQQ